ncbi:MAG: ABC transporter permease [Culturomica sp.]|jgi:ABC-type antimicrobial peptide transport system permease subunit|nr:ABC transporter permease [Culturomica sp.]
MKNLRLAIRSLLHFRLYSAVNVLGLALSLACVIVIARYVHNETTVDRFNSRLDRIYVTTQESTNRTGEIKFSGIFNRNRETTFVDLRKAPAVERSTNFIYYDDQEMQSGENRYTIRSIVTDTSFLKILDYPILAGSGDLSAPDNILITEAFARKVFGESDPLGKQLTYNVQGKTVTVTGVIGPIRTKSTLTFDVIVPMSHIRMWSQVEETLVLLHPNQDYRAVNEKYSGFFEMKIWDYSIRYQLFPLRKVYLDHTILDYGIFQHGKRSSIAVLSLVGLLIGLVGVFNFINIYTAVILRRGREFGMKKVFGAPGGQVFLQLLIENLLMIALALLIALALTELLNPVVRNLLGFDQMPFRQFDALLAFGLLIGLPLVTTFFPFVHYNYAAPVKSLQSVGKTGGRSSARRLFLTFQYILTIGMIAVSLLFLKQLHFMLHADLGFSTAGIIKVPILKNIDSFDHNGGADRWREISKKEETIRQRLAASPLFIEYSMGGSPVHPKLNTSNFRLGEGDNELKPLTMLAGDEKWLKLFGLELTQGRFFNDEQENFYTYHLMLTESALPYMGITDIRTDRIQPESRWWWSYDRKEEMKTNPAYEIVGVVRDFYPSHLGIQTPPIVIMFDNGGYYSNPVLAKVAPGKRQEAIEFMRRLHEEMTGGEFTYTFIEDDVKALYAEDRKVATVYGIFTGIAIAISVLGLFSLSLFDIQQRRREIAIRKVNGATTGNVLGLLLKRYLYLLLIAFVIAVPLAWFAIQRYLENFARKTAVSWWIFAVALLVTAGVSLLTLIRQTRKAASADPARVIRSE